MVASNKSYIGQYGESLRRLTALGNHGAPGVVGIADQRGGSGPALGGNAAGDMLQNYDPSGAQANTARQLELQRQQDQQDQQGPSGLSQAAGALSAMGGAFAATHGAPDAPASGQPAGTMGALGALGGQSGGLGQMGSLQQPGAGAGTDERSKIGFHDIVNASSSAHKDAAIKNLEKQGVNIKDAYASMHENGFAPPPEKLSTRELGMRVLEFGLRMSQAVASGRTGWGAAADAGAGLMQSLQDKKDKAEADQNRLTDKADAKAEKNAERAARSGDIGAEIAGRHADTNAEIASRERIATAKAKADFEAAKLEAKRSKNPMQYVDADGTAKLVTANDDGTFTVSTPTEDVVTQGVDSGGGRNSMPRPTEVHTKRPIKPLQRPTSVNTLSPGDIGRAIEQEKTRLSKDLAMSASLRKAGLTGADADQELERIARQRVMTRQPQNDSGGDGGNDPLGYIRQ